MRAVIQRVRKANVVIGDEIFSSIERGIVVLLGISINDSEYDIEYITDKIINLRIFSDEINKLNNDIKSISGEILIISQFTLYGDARKGRRPSYSNAANGEFARVLYDKFVNSMKFKYIENKIKTGIFASMMQITLTNDGPVTILLDSEKKF